MPSVASVRPARWAVLRSLRELTRLAVTVLVLAVGLGGALATTPPDAPTQVRPSAVSSRVDILGPAAAAEQASTQRTGQPAELRPVSTVAAATGPVIVGPQQAPAADPTRGTPYRRGPPTR
ncbi:hypothetical protein [Micromonospora vulcania]|uniref:Uncharacterized protein n=1 Tax=Micromonospora vulcania TaxID=1441873 RepID=A0ABW1HCP1_9ACTN